MTPFGVLDTAVPGGLSFIFINVCTFGAKVLGVSA